MSRLDHIWTGLRSVPRAARWLWHHPRLWGWALLPWIIQLLIFALSIVVLSPYWQPAVQWIVAQAPHWGAETPGIAGLLLSAVSGLVRIVCALVANIAAIVVIFVSAFLAGQICAGPLWELYAERIYVTRHPEAHSTEHWMRRALHAFGAEIIKTLFFLLVPALLFALHLIPVMGSALAIVCTVLFSTWALGAMLADYTMMQRTPHWRARGRQAWAQRWTLVGLGLMASIPGAAVLAAPILIIAGNLCVEPST